MNLFKQLSLALVVIVCSIFVSCQKEEITTPPTISLSTDSLTVESDSVAQIITIEASLDWEIEKIDSTWLSLSAMDGKAGKNDFIVKIKQNSTLYPRQAIVTLHLKDKTDVTAKLHITQNGIKGERATLMKIYNLLEGNMWSEQGNWNTELPISQWRGIKVNTAGNVISLDIDKGAYGDLPQEIFDLVHLEEICLQYCPDVKGDISPNIKNLKHLRIFRAAGASITSIPSTIGELPMLQELTMSGNKLTRITPEIGNIRTLRTLDLSSNALEGGIPEGFGSKLLSLSTLSLRENPKLGGEIPASIFTKYLTFFSAYGCMLKGTIPAEIGNSTKLATIKLQENYLEGEIPETIGNLVELITLNLQDNNLTGNIPESLTNIPALNMLEMDLARNQLSGTIPQSILDHPRYSVWSKGICDQRGDGFTNCQK